MKRFVGVLVAAALFYSCQEESKYELEKRDNFKTIDEKEFVEIKLEGEASSRYAEFSGLTWYKDDLILLPQFPYQFGDGLTGSLFLISKDKIKNYLNSASSKPIEPKKIKLFADGLEEFNKWGSGYEAVAVRGDSIYFALELYGNTTKGFIVKGKIDESAGKIVIDSKSLMENDFCNRIENQAEEAITFYEDELIIIHESNGKNTFPSAYASLVNSHFSVSRRLPLVNLEYRITDASEVESDSTFWVINYLWIGDIEKLKVTDDPILKEYGVGESYKTNYNVERLVKLKINRNNISLTNTPPLYIELPVENYSRNWEGLVKFEDEGFLLVSDRHPRTILAFVPR